MSDKQITITLPAALAAELEARKVEPSTLAVTLLEKYCKQLSADEASCVVPWTGAGAQGDAGFTLAEVLKKFSAGPTSGIFTDGSARPNPGPGGWGYVWVEKGKVLKQAHGHNPETTNNRMELTGIIEALKQLPEDTAVELFTDSELTVNILTKWAKGWEQRGWRRRDGEIANLDLVQRAYELVQSHRQVSIKWIKAHNGWLWNEYADSLSSAWARGTL